eukprot:5272117-Prorocentrum_lima.AAC.1
MCIRDRPRVEWSSAVMSSENQALRESTSTHNVDIGLLRMMLSMTNGRNATLTTTDIANAFLNAPISKDAVILVSAKHPGKTGNC